MLYTCTASKVYNYIGVVIVYHIPETFAGQNFHKLEDHTPKFYTENFSE